MTDEATRSGYAAYLTTYPWEWSATIRLPSQNHGHYLKKIRTKMLRTEGGQLATMGVFSTYNGPHVHLLMLGRFSKAGRGYTLRGIDRASWEEVISDMVRDKKRGCKIDPIESGGDLQKMAAYVVEPKNMQGLEMLQPWGRILKTIKSTT